MTDREIRKLIDTEKPYSEMTEEELNAVIEWKIDKEVQLRTNESIFKNQLEQNKELIEKTNNICIQMRDNYVKLRDEIKEDRKNRRLSDYIRKELILDE